MIDEQERGRADRAGPLAAASDGRWQSSADDRHALIQVEHHVIHDGWSFSLMLGEMRSALRGRGRRPPEPAPALEFQYADFARWQRDFMTRWRLESSSTTGRGALAGAPEAPFLPGDREAPDGTELPVVARCAGISPRVSTADP